MKKSSIKLMMPVLMIILLLIMLFPVSALQKSVEGFVFENDNALKDKDIQIFMNFQENEKTITCMTFPEILTDNRGYFITNLANLRILGNNNPCEDKWKKGYEISVLADGYLTELPDKEKILIDSESGATMTLQKLILTDRKFEPDYSNLDLANLKIVSLGHLVDWKSKKVIFNAEVYNPNNVPFSEVYLKIAVSDDNDIVSVVENRLELDALETKPVEITMDIKDIGYGKYNYHALLFTPLTTYDRISDRELELKPIMGIFTVQNIIILLMSMIIIILIIYLIRSKKKRK